MSWPKSPFGFFCTILWGKKNRINILANPTKEIPKLAQSDQVTVLYRNLVWEGNSLKSTSLSTFMTFYLIEISCEMLFSHCVSRFYLLAILTSWCGKPCLCPFLRYSQLALKNLPACAADETWVSPWVGKIPWRRAWQPTPVSLPGESHGQRTLAGYSPWGHKEWDTAEATSHTHTPPVKR